MAEEAKQNTEMEEDKPTEDPSLNEADGIDSEPDAVSSELDGLREALLRAHAEMDNVHKRSAREIERARLFALERFIRDLVPVIDSLEQALASEVTEASTQAGTPEGLRLVHRQLLGALERHGLEVLDPAGERFDPNWHEAMTTQPADEVEPDTVLQVLQKGFRLHERLVRPARVIVARSFD